ncbi:MAG TPA: hypothetical protein VFC19_39250 [Candidatus Limnocylindrales bacterium]|nr:hypothetical protein [Candidatus Limnocylindrales bacterium]
MTSAHRPPTLADESEQLARQLAILRGRSRRVAREVQRIRAELVDLIKRIDTHFSGKDGIP